VETAQALATRRSVEPRRATEHENVGTNADVAGQKARSTIDASVRATRPPGYSMIRPLRIPMATASVRLVAFSLLMIEAT
jgi:hypothetical protein